MDFFQAVQELEDNVRDRVFPALRAQEEIFDELAPEKAFAPQRQEKSPNPASAGSHKIRRCKRKRTIGPKRPLNNRDRKRQEYYHHLHQKRYEYYDAARYYAMNGGDPNFVYGVNTPQELLCYEKDNIGIPFLHTCAKNLPTFRYMIHKGADMFVADVCGKTVLDIQLRDDVRKYLQENNVFAADSKVVDRSLERIRCSPIRRGFVARRC